MKELEEKIIDMKKIRSENCKKGDHEFGWNTVTHENITHPTGIQICLSCGKTFRQLLAEERKENIGIRKNWIGRGIIEGKNEILNRIELGTHVNILRRELDKEIKNFKSKYLSTGGKEERK